MLLLQNIRVLFPAPTTENIKPPVTPVPGVSTLLASTGTYMYMIHIQIA